MAQLNLIRICGLWTRHNQGNLEFQNTKRRAPGRSCDPEKLERIRKRKERKKKNLKTAAKIGGVGLTGAAAVGGAGLILGAGALAIVANPYDVDYNADDLLDVIEDGFYEGLEYAEGLDIDPDIDIDFGDLIAEANGELGEFADIELPDIDFAEFNDVLGELFGEISEFGEGAIEAIAEGVGEFVGGIDF